MAILCAWPGGGIPETRTEFTGAAEAARVWCSRGRQPPDAREPELPEPRDVPDGGWFARVLDR